MSDRSRGDFVKVRPRSGCGGVSIVNGNFTLKLAAGETAEITRAEWTSVYAQCGALEEVQELKSERVKEASAPRPDASGPRL